MNEPKSAACLCIPGLIGASIGCPKHPPLNRPRAQHCSPRCSPNCCLEPHEHPALNRFAEAPNVKSVITQAVAAGSVCWHGGTGDAVFDGETAEQIADDAMERIAQIIGIPGWQGSKLFGQYTIGEGIGEQ